MPPGVVYHGKNFFENPPLPTVSRALITSRCCKTSTIRRTPVGVPVLKLPPSLGLVVLPTKTAGTFNTTCSPFLKLGNCLSRGKTAWHQEGEPRWACGAHTSRPGTLEGHWHVRPSVTNRAENAGVSGTYPFPAAWGDDASCLAGSRPVGKLPTRICAQTTPTGPGSVLDSASPWGGRLAKWTARTETVSRSRRPICAVMPVTELSATATFSRVVTKSRGRWAVPPPCG